MRALVPSDGALGTTWTQPDFNDSAWTHGTNGVGYDTGDVNPGEDLVISEVLASSPLIYLRMNETSGTTAANLGSNPLSGTYANVTLNAAGPRSPTYGGFEVNNAAAQFNGSSSSVTVNSSFMNNLAAFTLSGWINLAGTQAARTGLFGQNDAIEFGFSTGSNLQIWTPGGGQANLTWTLPNNQWYHVVVIGNGSSLAIYTNGVLAATGGASTSNYGSSSYPFHIGGNGVFDASGNWFNGKIDEVAVWTRALSPTEIQQQYQAAIAPTTTISYHDLIGTDVQSDMLGHNSSCYIRYTFNVTDPSQVDRLTLRLKYDDGFAAYLNGTLVAARNTPADPYANPLAWNAAASTSHSDAAALAGEDINITTSAGALRLGTNVLAIQGLNTSATNADFLIHAEIIGTSIGEYSSVPRYFSIPTPGSINGAGSSDLGPIISEVGRDPAAPYSPTMNDPITVTARVQMAFASVTNVTLYYRVMWGETNALTMYDDGLHGDGTAGDALFAATIPAGVATNGEMLRWFIRASDAAGRASRWPLFGNPTADSEYEGTMILDPSASSQLQVWYFFIDPNSPNWIQPISGIPSQGVDSEAGGRCSMFFNGELYDNIYMELRGNTTASYPKKSHRVEFNADHPLRGAVPGAEIRKTSLLSETADPAYLRTYLSFWLLDKMGVPSPFDYPVRCQLNGQFWGLWFNNDVMGADQLARLGYDPLGALYKAAGTVTPDYFSTGGFEKKTRLWENRSDYDALAAGINETNALDARRDFIFDNLNLPEIVNYLATERWTQEGDDVWANMTLYRDTMGSKEWFIIPFDLNVSWGQLYCGDYAGFSAVESTDDAQKSHPLYGGSQVVPSYRTTVWNRIYDVVIAVPETREMLLRRERTLLENFIQPPGTPFDQGVLEQEITRMTNAMWPEMYMDRTKNGWPCTGTCGMYCWGEVWPDNATYGVPGLFTQFIEPRRTHFWVTHSITNTATPIGLGNNYNAGIPESQPTNAALNVFTIDYNPVSGNQAEEFICLTNPTGTALDISGWQLDGAARFTFHPGTIVPSNSVIYVSPDVLSFRNRSTGPRGGQGLFVVGPYSGQLSARGESIQVKDDTGRLVDSLSYPGTPSLAQQYLRITELMYHPAPLVGNTNDAAAFEYVEFKNISTNTTLNLTGVRFTNGIDFTFTGSAVTSLAPGQTVLIVKDLTAFTARYGNGLPVAGEYTGYLDNAGERLQLLDASGEEILDFSYKDSWYPITDGLGFSLVVVDEHAEPDAWDSKSNWRPSSLMNGSAGSDDPTPVPVAPILVNEALTHTELSTDAIELFNPTTNFVDISGWYLSDDFNAPAKFSIPPGTIMGPGSYIIFTEAQFDANPDSPRSFALGADGDEIYLFSANSNGELTGYYHGFQFGAADNEVSFGRYVTSDRREHFVAQSAVTLGTNNAPPAVGPVVINEIHYHPADVGTNDNTADEFIELFNITPNSVPLYDLATPPNPWQVKGGVDYTFPPNVTLDPSEFILLVNFNPTNSVAADAFRAKYDVDANIRLFGPYGGKLNNASDNVELKKPIFIHATQLAYVLVDEIDYSNGTPWPCNTDGTGMSLQRQQPEAFGDDPINWRGITPTAGTSNTLLPPGAPDIVVQPIGHIIRTGSVITFTVAACGTPPFFYQWQHDSESLLGATNSNLTLTNALLSDSGVYTVIVSNLTGAVTSDPATLVVMAPPVVATQPSDQTVQGGETATFTVGLEGTPPFSYQWRFYGTNLPAATSATLDIVDAQLDDVGPYSVVVSNAVGETVSSNAILTVMVPATVTAQPESVTINSGGTNTITTQTATFTVSAVGMGSLSYQWTFWGTNLPGATSSTLTISNVSLDNAGPYNVRVTDSVRSVVSDTADLTVLVKPVIYVPPQAVSIASGGTVSLSVLAGPNHPTLPLTYAWRRGSLVMEPDGKPTYIVTNVTVNVFYGVVVSNAFGALPASYARITVLPDSDHDGLPDAYENAIGLDPNLASDSTLDLDGDGMSTLDEYYAGTDPTDPESVLKLHWAADNALSQGQVRFSFEAISNKTYSIEYKDTLMPGDWSNLLSLDSLPTNRIIWVTNSLPTGVLNRFFRAKVPLNQ